MHIYEAGFRRLNFGYAALLSMAMFVILVILTMIQLRVMRTEWEY
jgi:ABC-type sugar transport system permease subunit